MKLINWSKVKTDFFISFCLIQARGIFRDRIQFPEKSEIHYPHSFPDATCPNQQHQLLSSASRWGQILNIYTLFLPAYSNQYTAHPLKRLTIVSLIFLIEMFSWMYDDSLDKVFWCKKTQLSDQTVFFYYNTVITDCRTFCRNPGILSRSTLSFIRFPFCLASTATKRRNLKQRRTKIDCQGIASHGRYIQKSTS